MTGRIERLAEGVTLYLGDCRQILPTLGKVDAVVTDPPYGINYETWKPSRISRPYTKAGDVPRRAVTKDHHFERIIGDNEPFDPAELLPLARSMVLWGANHYATRLPESMCWFSWDKKVGKAADSSIGDCELAWTRGLPFETVRCFRHMWAGFQRDSQVGDQRLHPTEKPIALMKWCIEFFPDARTILDPFMGSGTTGVAAVKLGRKFIGIEIEPKYFDIACRRIQAALDAPDLFVERPKPAEQQKLGF
jgi:site-specific DNA-methyltransferase (adenine-specific)